MIDQGFICVWTQCRFLLRLTAQAHEVITEIQNTHTAPANDVWNNCWLILVSIRCTNINTHADLYLLIWVKHVYSTVNLFKGWSIKQSGKQILSQSLYYNHCFMLWCSILSFTETHAHWQTTAYCCSEVYCDINKSSCSVPVWFSHLNCSEFIKLEYSPWGKCVCVYFYT